MAKEWILNHATNRWGLNKKSRVGPVAKWIREFEPKSVEQWRRAYLKRLAQWLEEKGEDMAPEAYLNSLGERLYDKIREVIRKEVDEVTLEDCINYIWALVIDRTFEGYEREIETVYHRIQDALEVEVQPAPDEMDRLYHVDFLIPVGKWYIGIQIKPVTYMQQDDLHRWLAWMEEAHRRFTKRYGGRVFIVYSRREGRKHRITNPEVIEEIRREIRRLQSEA